MDPPGPRDQGGPCSRDVSGCGAPRPRRLLGRWRHHRRRYRRLRGGHRGARRGRRLRDRVPGGLRAASRSAGGEPSRAGGGRGAARPICRWAGPHRRLTPRALHRERDALCRDGRLGSQGRAADRGASGGIAGRERAPGERYGRLRGRVVPPRYSHAGAARPVARGLARRARCVVGADALHPRRAGRSGGRAAACPRERRGGALPAVQPRTRPRRRTARGAARRRTPGGARNRFRRERGDPRSAGGGPGGSRARGARCRAGPRALHPRRRARPRPRARDRESWRRARWGDCVVIRARAVEDGSRNDLSAEDRVLASGPRDVLATFVGGRDVHRSSPPL